MADSRVDGRGNGIDERVDSQFDEGEKKGRDVEWFFSLEQYGSPFQHEKNQTLLLYKIPIHHNILRPLPPSHTSKILESSSRK